MDEQWTRRCVSQLDRFELQPACGGIRAEKKGAAPAATRVSFTANSRRRGARLWPTRFAACGTDVRYVRGLLQPSPENAKIVQDLFGIRKRGHDPPLASRATALIFSSGSKRPVAYKRVGINVLLRNASPAARRDHAESIGRSNRSSTVFRTAVLPRSSWRPIRNRRKGGRTSLLSVESKLQRIQQSRSTRFGPRDFQTAGQRPRNYANRRKISIRPTALHGPPKKKPVN